MPERSSIKMPGWLIVILVWAIPIAMVVVGVYVIRQPKPDYRAPHIPMEGQSVGPDEASGDAPGAAEKPASPTELAERELNDLSQRLTAAVSDKRPLDVITEAIRRFTEKHDGWAAAHRLYGLALLEARQFDKAYAQLSHSLKIEPDNAEAQLNAGTVALRLEQHADARTHYERAIRLDPENARFILHRAQLDLEAGDTESARTSIETVLSLDSSNHRGYAMFSHLLERQGEIDAALGMLQNAIEKTPIAEQSVQNNYLLQKARLLRKAQRYDGAMQVLRKILFLDAADLVALREAALTWQAIGKPAEGAELYEAAMQEKPDKVELAIGAARWRLVAGDREAAQRHLLTARSLQAHHPAFEQLQAKLNAGTKE